MAEDKPKPKPPPIKRDPGRMKSKGMPNRFDPDFRVINFNEQTSRLGRPTSLTGGSAPPPIKRDGWPAPKPETGGVRLSIQREQVRSAKFKASKEGAKPEGLIHRLPSTRILLAVLFLGLFIALYYSFGWEKAPAFEADEYRGKIAFDTGEELDVRMDISSGDDELGVTTWDNTLTVLSYNTLPPILAAAYSPETPFKAIGTYVPVSGYFSVKLSSTSGDTKGTIELEGNESSTADMKYDLLSGKVLIDRKESGSFKMIRPK